MKTSGRILSILTTLFVCNTSQGVIFTVSGPTVNPANGHSYYIVSQGTFAECEAYAQILGGHLATINDAAENAWVFSNLVATNPDRNPWIGLVSPNTLGPWSWVSGEPVTYLPWAPGEPNNIGSPPDAVNIFQVNSPYPGMWNNAPQYDPYQGIVEVVPEPSSFALVTCAGFAWVFQRVRRR